MKKELKVICITVAVLAVLQLVGGIFYTAMTAKEEKSYTYVECTIVWVQRKEDDDTTGDDTVAIEGITVSYIGDDGQTVVAQMADFPSSFSVGETFTGRFRDDPLLISAEHTDWFTPVFLIVLGAAYAVIDIILFLLRKKMGLYAMESVADDYIYEDESDEESEDDSEDTRP